MDLDRKLVDAVDHLERLAVRAADRVAPRPAPTPAGARLPPGPPPRRGPVLGSIAYYLRFLVDPIGFVAERFATYGDIYRAPSPDGDLFAIRHPDHLQEVLVSRASHYAKTHTAFERMARVLGTGLLTSDGAVWRRHRRMIQPAFAHARLAAYAAVFVEEALRTAARLGGGEERDMAAEMTDLTLRAVSRALFRHPVEGETAVVARAMVELQETLVRPDIAPAWLPSPRRKRLERAIADLDRIIYGLIAARRRARAGAAGEPADLLQVLVDAVDEEGDGGRLGEAEVRDELLTMFLAGHETTSNTLAWTLYLLSQHPEAEAKLHAELDAVLGDRTPVYADLERLPYVEQVIHEAMRLYPPAFMVARRAQQDTEIGGYPVPRGSEVVCWIYLTHHDARWYPEPERFRPERFAPEAIAALPRLAHAPFGAGPRACIGKMFALVEARLVLAILAQRFHFELAPDQRVAMSPRITLTPKHGMRMRARARRPAAAAS